MMLTPKANWDMDEKSPSLQWYLYSEMGILLKDLQVVSIVQENEEEKIQDASPTTTNNHATCTRTATKSTKKTKKETTFVALTPIAKNDKEMNQVKNVESTSSSSPTPTPIPPPQSIEISKGEQQQQQQETPASNNNTKAEEESPVVLNDESSTNDNDTTPPTDDKKNVIVESEIKSKSDDKGSTILTTTCSQEDESPAKVTETVAEVSKSDETNQVKEVEEASTKASTPTPPSPPPPPQSIEPPSPKEEEIKDEMKETETANVDTTKNTGEEKGELKEETAPLPSVSDKPSNNNNVSTDVSPPTNTTTTTTTTTTTSSATSTNDSSTAKTTETTETTTTTTTTTNTQGKYYTIQELMKPIDGVEWAKREEYLSDQDFQTHLGVSRSEFQSLAGWKRQNAKKKAGIF